MRTKVSPTKTSFFTHSTSTASMAAHVLTFNWNHAHQNVESMVVDEDMDANVNVEEEVQTLHPLLTIPRHMGVNMQWLH